MYSGGRFGRCVGVEAVNALLAKWPAWLVVVGSERNVVGGVAVAGVGCGVRAMGTDAFGVYGRVTNHYWASGCVDPRCV